MQSKYRGSWFGAYYLSTTPNLFGQTWLNCFNCGSAQVNGVTYGLYFLLAYKDINLGDSKGTCSEVFDVCLIDGDDPDVISANITGIIKGDEVVVVKKGEVKPPTPVETTKAKADIQARKVIDFSFTKSKLPVKAFVASTFDQLLKARPELWQPIIDKESGVEIPNICKCNFGPEVDS